MTQAEKEEFHERVHRAWQKAGLGDLMEGYTIEVNPEELETYREAYDWPVLEANLDIRIRADESVPRGNFAVTRHDKPEGT